MIGILLRVDYFTLINEFKNSFTVGSVIFCNFNLAYLADSAFIKLR